METTNTQITEATLTAVIVRADGTVEELGVIDSYTRPWWRSLLARFTRRS